MSRRCFRWELSTFRVSFELLSCSIITDLSPTGKVKGVAKIAKKLEFDYAEAVVSPPSPSAR